MRKLFIAAALGVVAALAPLAAAALPPGQIVYEANNYTHITTNTTTVVKAASGLLSWICINTKGATGNTLTVDDATSATTPTVIIIDTTAAAQCWHYDVVMKTGITVVTATGTAADVTVAWR